MAVTSIEQAIAEEPEGAVCGHCGGKNEWWDDCGFFYTYNTKGEYVASCGCEPVHTSER